MTDPSPFRLVDVVLLLVILATAAGARVGYLSTFADHAANAGPYLVQDEAPPEDLMDNLHEHQWFGRRAPLSSAEELTADVAPGYSWLLGRLRRLPLNEGALPPLIRWLQCGLGTLTAGLYYLFARRAFPGRAVAILAGLFCALHPFWIINTAALNDGTLVSFLLAACVWLGCRGGQVGGPLTSLLYGAALAALALVRAALLPFAGVALLWFLWRSRSLAGGWQSALLAFLGFGTALAPWTIRNYEEFGDIIPIVDSTYLHLWVGNNPRATGGPMTDTDMLAALAQERGEEPSASAEWLGSLNQAERYRALGGPVFAEVSRDPAATLLRRLWASLYFAFGAETFAPSGKPWRETPGNLTEELRENSPYPTALSGSLLVMLVLGLLGWRWTYAFRREAMPSSLALMWVPLPYLLSHAEALSGPRLPLDGVLLSYAAFALVYLLPGLGAPLRAGSLQAKDEDPGF